MNTLTYLIGNVLFPKLVRANNVKKLRMRMNWLAVAFALVLAGGVVGVMLASYHHPGRAAEAVKPLRK